MHLCVDADIRVFSCTCILQRLWYLLSNSLEVQDSELRDFVNDIEPVGGPVDYLVPQQAAQGGTAVGGWVVSCL